MTELRSDLALIVAKASSLSERLSNENFRFDATQVDTQRINERLTHWCQVAAQGNWEKFQKRLRWDCLDMDALNLALGSLPLVDDRSLPVWAETLEELMQRTEDFCTQVEAPSQYEIQNLSPLDSENPMPFEDVLLPAILLARKKLMNRLGFESLSLNHIPLSQLSEEAYFALERNLFERLLNLCAKTLMHEFSTYRPEGHNLLNLLAGELPGTHKKVHYNAFVQKLLSDGLLTFFQKYPVLGRLSATIIDLWVEGTAEFLQRLEEDQQKIQREFAFPEQLERDNRGGLGKVIRIKTSISDPHCGGRSVIALLFESGLKVVYKPKSLGLEVAYTQFLDWCNQNGLSLSLKVLKVLNRHSYGWVEYVEHQPCENESAVRRFYQRAGMLLCLLYVLGATDCHHENLIACGEHLVLVDMETLMQHKACPLVSSAEATEAEMTLIQQFQDSVLRTGLLPSWDLSKDERIAYDVSGLGSIDPQQAPWQAPKWRSVNTDDMHFAYEPVTITIQSNVPILKGEPVTPNEYLDDMEAGFQLMYDFLMKHRESILAPNSPLTALSAKHVRFVFRETLVYGVILQRSIAPECLRDGIDRSIELDLLSRAFLTAQEKPTAWPILRAEQKALEQLDIPYFGAYTDSDAFTEGLELPIERYFEESSYNQLIARLRKINETDLVQQVAFIRGAFIAKVARTPRAEYAPATKASTFGDADLNQITYLTSTELLEEAEAIAWEIQERALKGTNGDVNWIGFSYIHKAERFQLQPLSENLYDGRYGIALFLSALDYVTESDRFRRLALAALQPLKEVSRGTGVTFTQRLAKSSGIGGATGLGSIIYSLVRIGSFLQDGVLLEVADQVANLITPAVIDSEQQLDVIGGSAGAILGLLALYGETKKPATLNTAIACGEHLILHQVSVDGAPRAWRTLGERPLTGFSHGAAGISYALLRLYEVTGNEAFLEAALEGIAYERSVFSESDANWPDFRPSAQQDGQPRFMISWCHGAPGIGLARLGGITIYHDEEIHRDIIFALGTTQKHDWQGVDHLCCGNFGRIEVMLVAAQKLSRPQWQEVAQKNAAWVVTRAKQTGEYKLFGNLPNSVFSPGFFQGTAGIGYELLRLLDKKALPSILLWE
jgi:type 2 lantibiotic biosynthesis protein LanM